MLDIILALIELITGEKQKQPPPRRNRQAHPQGRPQQQSGDPFRREQTPAANAGQPQEEALSIEDVIRRLTGQQEEEAEPAPPPPQRRRPPPATRQQPGRGQRPQQVRSRPAPAAPAKPAAVPVTTRGEQTQPARNAAERSTASDFVAELRNDPNAARRAFIYSEIFGKPLADRQSQ